jgi:dipeptidyl aminopeptidase/acylaminoacyl peptidase
MFALSVLLSATTPTQDTLPPQQKTLYEQWMQVPKLITNVPSDPVWGAGDRRLWYWLGIPDHPELYVFDLETNTVRPYLDTTRVRAALASKLGHEPTGAGLPFQSFAFSDSTESGIRFRAEGREFELQPETYVITERPPVPEATRLLTQPQRTRAAMSGGAPTDLFEVRSPDGRWFAHLKDHNVWLRSAEDGHLVQLTRDGVEDYAWGADWANAGWAWWSPDGQRLAVRKEDNREVFKAPILKYEASSAQWVPPSVQWVRHPSIDGDQSQPEIWILDPGNLTHTRIDLGPEPDQQIRRIGWQRDGSALLFQRLNRQWTKWELLAADPATGTVRVVLSESQDYLRGDRTQGIRFLADGKRFLRLSDQDGWAHVSLYDLRGNLVQRLTHGNWDVRNIVSIAEGTGWVYVRGSDDPARPYDRHLYRVRLDGTGFARLTDAPGRHEVSVSRSGEYFFDRHSDLARPWVTDIRRGDGTLVRTIASADISRLRELGWSAPEPFVVKADDGVTDLHGILWKPATFDPSRKYPVIEYIYGGAQSEVPTGFSGWDPGVWTQAMAQLGFITIHLESRGTASRGRQFAAWKFGNVGRYEIPDHVAALRQLAAGRPYMDLRRVGIYGYSWGGHFAMRALLQAPDVYHVGVAGGPDIDLRAYDEPGDPEHRGDLDYGSNYWLADRLQGKLLMYSGTLEPGQGFMKMVNEFVRHGTRVDLMLFPGRGHDLEPSLHQGYILPMVRDYFVEHLKR